MTRIVVAGAGAIGASIAYHLAVRGARDVVLAERAAVAAGASGRAMGGIRQQFSTAAEVLLARASIRFFEELGPPFFHQVGYLFLASSEAGLAELEERLALQRSLGVPVARVDPSFVPGLATDDVLGAVFCPTDGVGAPAAVTRELVRRAVERGVELREGTAAEDVSGDLVVIACGAASARVAAHWGVELPVRPLVRQLFATTPVAELPDRLPMTIELETGFHFRRRDDRLVVAMADPEPRWSDVERVDASLLPDRLARLARRYPPAADTAVDRAWAGLYDMTPDAHPIIGPVADGVYAACGFSGHGFMQAPAVGAAVAEELLERASSLDLSPYRLARFADGADFPETLIL
ncbi:MAG: FAD-binding oxidoreductase [Thermoleophilia bacterium]|nr:FAD-binding oxidoreductase [Thermoleophilia bacterium]